MPRQARIVLPGYLHHVTQRGNYRQKVFFNDQDRVVYLKYLEENALKDGVKIYAFCLMDNHVHFIVKPLEDESLSRTFRVAHQRYSLYLNKRLNQFGHRWQSRYYSCVLLADHIAKAVRYVERNPVRAGIVHLPWRYPWSSARARLKGGRCKILTLSDIKDYIDLSEWQEYLKQVDEKEDIMGIRQVTFQGKAFGEVEKVKKLGIEMNKQLAAVLRGRPKKLHE